MNRKPLLVVITPVRNEAWVLEAYLTCCSSWADHIIIADHHSTDGSREIAQQFPKVTLIDNPCEEWVEYECRARLLEEAAKIEGDKIIFALDADEFLSEGFTRTEGWQRILRSKPNEIFAFRWLNLYDDLNHAVEDTVYSEWAAHFAADVDVVAEYRALERNAVHCQRVPCIEGSRCRYIEVGDIRFVHLGNLNTARVRNKLDFYQVVNFDKNPRRANAVSMYRSYHAGAPAGLAELPVAVRLWQAEGGGDASLLLRQSDYGKHYIDEMEAIIRREGTSKFRSLCIWENPYLKERILFSPPPCIIN